MLVGYTELTTLQSPPYIDVFILNMVTTPSSELKDPTRPVLVMRGEVEVLIVCLLKYLIGCQRVLLGAFARSKPVIPRNSLFPWIFF